MRQRLGPITQTLSSGDVGALEEGRTFSDCSAVQLGTHVSAGYPVAHGRYSTVSTQPRARQLDAGRERRDLARHGARRIDAFGCCTARAIAIHSQPRDQAQWRSIGLPSHRRRQRCLGSCTSSEARQTGRQQGLGAHRDRQASAAVVAGANRRVAQAYLSERPEPARVTRDHLPQPVHSISRRLEEGTAAALETHARHASVSALHPEDRYPRADRWCRVDQRATCVRRGSCGGRLTETCAAGFGGRRHSPAKSERQHTVSCCHPSNDSGRRQKTESCRTTFRSACAIAVVEGTAWRSAMWR